MKHIFYYLYQRQKLEKLFYFHASNLYQRQNLEKLCYVSYFQLVGIEGIHTAPAGLESTCLVLAYGLGKFRVK